MPTMGWLTPDMTAHRLWEIPLDALKTRGIRAVLLDLDNTLVPWHTQSLDDRTRTWLEGVADAGITVLLVTNATGERAGELARTLGIRCVPQAGKPLPRGVLRAARELKLPPAACAMVGDQLFTDVMAAHWAGCLAVLVDPLDPREMGWTRFVRRLERRLLRRDHRWERKDGDA